MQRVPWLCLRLRVTRCGAQAAGARAHLSAVSRLSPKRRPMFMLVVARRDADPVYLLGSGAGTVTERL